MPLSGWVSCVCSPLVCFMGLALMCSLQRANSGFANYARLALLDLPLRLQLVVLFLWHASSQGGLILSGPHSFLTVCLDFCRTSSASLLFLANFTSSPENFCLWCPCVAGLSCSRIRHPVSLGRLVGLRPGCDSSRPLPCQWGGLCAWHGCV